MAFDLWTKRFLVLAALAAGVCVTGGGGQSISPAGAEARAVEFLMREVPAWSQNNGCFSCHNNGDGARALYAATRKGYSVPARVLAETTAWVGRPDRWDHNKGDPVGRTAGPLGPQQRGPGIQRPAARRRAVRRRSARVL